MGNLNNLVIVESPSKAKTIGKYLGPDYTVRASMGHLRDLPKSTMGVDLEGNFDPHYIPVRGKEELIKELKKESAKRGNIVANGFRGARDRRFYRVFPQQGVLCIHNACSNIGAAQIDTDPILCHIKTSFRYTDSTELQKVCV